MFQFSLLTLFLLPAAAAPLPLHQSRDTQYGRGTWFNVGMGACGYWNTNTDPIVALSAQIYGAGANCGQWVRVTNTANGQTAYGMTRDECQSCASTDLDMSPGLFQKLGDLNTGVLSISWNLMPAGWSPPS